MTSVIWRTHPEMKFLTDFGTPVAYLAQPKRQPLLRSEEMSKAGNRLSCNRSRHSSST